MVKKLQELAIKVDLKRRAFEEKANQAVKKAATDTQGDILQFLGIMVLVLILLGGLYTAFETFFPTVTQSIMDRIKSTFRIV